MVVIREARSKNNGRFTVNGGSRSDSRPDHGAYSVSPDRYEEIQSECDSVRRSPVCQDGPESAQPREYARRMGVVAHAGRSSAGPAAHQLSEQTRPSCGGSGIYRQEPLENHNDFVLAAPTYAGAHGTHGWSSVRVYVRADQQGGDLFCARKHVRDDRRRDQVGEPYRMDTGCE